MIFHVKNHLTPYSIDVHHGFPWNSMENVFKNIQWKKFHDYFHGIPWNTMEIFGGRIPLTFFHGIPWNSMEKGMENLKSWKI